MRCLLKETGKIQNMDNLIEEELRAAFGYGEEDLIAEFDQAASQMEESDRVPPEGEFEKIMSRVRELEEEKKKDSKKVVRLKKVGKIGLLVAVLGCVLLGTGIGVSGKRAYEYSLRASEKGNSVWNNTDYLKPEYKVEEAYQEIYDKLGIDVLRLVYIPEGMKFSDLFLGDGYARIEFRCNEKYIYFIQAQYPVENSGGTKTDCEEVKNTYNKLLKKDLLIEKNLLPNKEIEYFTEFAIDKTYYYLVGVISEEEFEKILHKIYY